MMSAVFIFTLLGDTIQRMIANLPPKRSTRHAIMFDAIKSRRKAAAFMVCDIFYYYICIQYFQCNI